MRFSGFFGRFSSFYWIKLGIPILDMGCFAIALMAFLDFHIPDYHSQCEGLCLSMSYVLAGIQNLSLVSDTGVA
jgi:hypothetical protein